jgi:hypothetical protein
MTMHTGDFNTNYPDNMTFKKARTHNGCEKIFVTCL